MLTVFVSKKMDFNWKCFIKSSFYTCSLLTIFMSVGLYTVDKMDKSHEGKGNGLTNVWMMLLMMVSGILPFIYYFIGNLYYILLTIIFTLFTLIIRGRYAISFHFEYSFIIMLDLVLACMFFYYAYTDDSIKNLSCCQKLNSKHGMKASTPSKNV